MFLLVWRTVRRYTANIKILAHMRVEEKRVHAPRERLPSHVDVRVFGNGRELASVLLLEVLLMLGMLLLDALNPKCRKNS